MPRRFLPQFLHLLVLLATLQPLAKSDLQHNLHSSKGKCWAIWQKNKMNPSKERNSRNETFVDFIHLLSKYNNTCDMCMHKFKKSRYQA